MAVNLVHITAKAEEHIVYMARVSNPVNQGNMSTAPKLIKYLIDHKHWSPFEMVNLCLEINTNRAIAAQILRHRSFTFQEFSQRYADVSQLGFDTLIPRKQDNKNRQNSTNDLSEEDKTWFLGALSDIETLSEKYYKQALEKGIAKESARFLLPLSTCSKLYMNGSIRSWIHYIQLRTSNGTQLEHKEIAEKCKQIFIKELPLVSQALGWL